MGRVATGSPPKRNGHETPSIDWLRLPSVDRGDQLIARNVAALGEVLGSAHDLRRGALTRAAIMGLTAFAISGLAGHRSLAMANRYVQRAGNALRPIADEVSER